jgi:hypothetical protein
VDFDPMNKLFQLLEDWRVAGKDRTWSLYGDSRPGYRMAMFVALNEKAKKPIKLILRFSESEEQWCKKIEIGSGK